MEEPDGLDYLYAQAAGLAFHKLVINGIRNICPALKPQVLIEDQPQPSLRIRPLSFLSLFQPLLNLPQPSFPSLCQHKASPDRCLPQQYLLQVVLHLTTLLQVLERYPWPESVSLTSLRSYPARNTDRSIDIAGCDFGMDNNVSNHCNQSKASQTNRTSGKSTTIGSILPPWASLL